MARFLRQSFISLRRQEQTSLIADIEEDAQSKDQSPVSQNNLLPPMTDNEMDARQDYPAEVSPMPERAVASSRSRRKTSQSVTHPPKRTKSEKKKKTTSSPTTPEHKTKRKAKPCKGKATDYYGEEPPVQDEKPQSRKRGRKHESAAEREGDLDDADDFVGGYDFKEFEDDRNATTNPDFSCLSPEEIIAAQKRQVSQIAEVLQISASDASNLLRSYAWKSEKLLTKYFEFNDPNEFLEEAGLLAGNGQTGEAILEGAEECLVCCEEVAPDESCALTCGHRICLPCWSTYLKVKITEGEVHRVSCPAIDCRLVVPDDVVRKLVDKPVFEKYLHFVTKSFVEDNTHLTWCPAPGCGNAITTDMVSGQVVLCSCGFHFCFSCHHEAHSPASCEQVRQWNKKCSDDSETGHWLGANTKDCPRCCAPVEKNGGCNHMSCRQCNYEWCWMCLKVWKGHDDFYVCARFEKGERKKAKSNKSRKQSKLQAQEHEREEQRLALERYISFYDKYLEFTNLIQKSQFREKARTLVQQLQTEQTTLTEVKFIEKAAEVLVACLEVIKYSFVYAYYLEDNSHQKLIFTMHQDNMIQTCSSLRSLLEGSNILARRTEVVDLTKLAEKRKANLLETDPVSETL